MKVPKVIPSHKKSAVNRSKQPTARSHQESSYSKPTKTKIQVQQNVQKHMAATQRSKQRDQKHILTSKMQDDLVNKVCTLSCHDSSYNMNTLCKSNKILMPFNFGDI